MNFEYKVGYHWKSPEKDPGQQSWKQGKFNKIARTDCRFRPSGFRDILPADRSRRIQHVGGVKSTFWDVGQLFWVESSKVKNHFFFFSSFLFSLSSSSILLSVLREKGLPRFESSGFQVPDWKYFDWRSVQEVQDSSVQVSEFRFWGFCSNLGQISVKPKLSSLLQQFTWWR